MLSIISIIDIFYIISSGLGVAVTCIFYLNLCGKKAVSEKVEEEAEPYPGAGFEAPPEEPEEPPPAPASEGQQVYQAPNSQKTGHWLGDQFGAPYKPKSEAHQPSQLAKKMERHSGITERPQVQSVLIDSTGGCAGVQINRRDFLQRFGREQGTQLSDDQQSLIEGVAEKEKVDRDYLQLQVMGRSLLHGGSKAGSLAHGGSKAGALVPGGSKADSLRHGGSRAGLTEQLDMTQADHHAMSLLKSISTIYLFPGFYNDTVMGTKRPMSTQKLSGFNDKAYEALLKEVDECLAAEIDADPRKIAAVKLLREAWDNKRLLTMDEIAFIIETFGFNEVMSMDSLDRAIDDLLKEGFINQEEANEMRATFQDALMGREGITMGELVSRRPGKPRTDYSQRETPSGLQQDDEDHWKRSKLTSMILSAMAQDTAYPDKTQTAHIHPQTARLIKEVGQSFLAPKSFSQIKDESQRKQLSSVMEGKSTDNRVFTSRIGDTSEIKSQSVLTSTAGPSRSGYTTTGASTSRSGVTTTGATTRTGETSTAGTTRSGMTTTGATSQSGLTSSAVSRTGTGSAYDTSASGVTSTGATSRSGVTSASAASSYLTSGATTRSGVTSSAATSRSGTTSGFSTSGATTSDVTSRSATTTTGATSRSGVITDATSQSGTTSGVSTTRSGVTTSGLTSRSGATTSGATSRSGVTSGLTSRSGVTSGATSLSGVTSGATSLSGVTSGVTSRSGVTSGVTSRSGVTSGVTSRSGVTSGVTSRSGVTTGATSVSGATSAATTSQSGVTSGATTSRSGVSSSLATSGATTSRSGATSQSGVSSSAATSRSGVSATGTRSGTSVSRTGTGMSTSDKTATTDYWTTTSYGISSMAPETMPSIMTPVSSFISSESVGADPTKLKQLVEAMKNDPAYQKDPQKRQALEKLVQGIDNNKGFTVAEIDEILSTLSKDVTIPEAYANKMVDQMIANKTLAVRTRGPILKEIKANCTKEGIKVQKFNKIVAAHTEVEEKTGAISAADSTQPLHRVKYRSGLPASQQKDFVKKVAASSDVFRRPCAFCGGQQTRDSTVVQGRHLHIGCCKCRVCGTKLPPAGTHISPDGVVLCERHFSQGGRSSGRKA